MTAFTYESMALLSSGDVAAAHAFVGGNVFFTETPNIKYVIPEEGGTMYRENICVLASAPNKENAMRFLEFYLQPEIAALNVARQFNGTPNIPANELTPEFFRSNPNINVPPETIARSADSSSSTRARPGSRERTSPRCRRSGARSTPCSRAMPSSRT